GTPLFLQRRATEELHHAAVPDIVHDALRSAGHPLDRSTREFMASRFDHDLSRVRVHTDARSAESAYAVHALAYTVGRDIVFASGQYAPQTPAGRKLLAHELAHVIQQSQHNTSAGLPGIDHGPTDPLEQIAEHHAEQI